MNKKREPYQQGLQDLFGISDEEMDTTTEWFTTQHGAFRFSPEQEAFVDTHKLGFSTQYIGMVRCYHDKRTVWQTSWAAGTSTTMIKKMPAASETNLQYLAYALRWYTVIGKSR